jgi:hypothetical protein
MIEQFERLKDSTENITPNNIFLLPKLKNCPIWHCSELDDNIKLNTMVTLKGFQKKTSSSIMAISLTKLYRFRRIL